MRSVAILTILLASSFAGCTDNSDGGTREVTTTKEVEVLIEAEPVEVTLETGGIDGLIVDEEELPIGGARVVLVGTDIETSSDAGGRFTFSQVDPGDYKVTIKKTGFATAGRAVPVIAGEISQLRVTLKQLFFDVPYHETHPWTGMVLAGFFTVAVGEGGSPGDPSCSACFLPCDTCVTEFNVTRGMRAIVFELEAQSTVANPVGDNDYFWQLLGNSRDYGRYGADYWIDGGKRQINGGWPDGGDDFRFTMQCGLEFVCVNQQFTVHFSKFYFQGPTDNFTALPE